MVFYRDTASHQLEKYLISFFNRYFYNIQNNEMWYESKDFMIFNKISFKHFYKNFISQLFLLEYSLVKCAYYYLQLFIFCPKVIIISQKGNFLI